MSSRCYKPVLTNLPDDMLAIILSKVGESSAEDFQACIFTCKTFYGISKFPDVLKNLNLAEVFPPPWNKIPKNIDFLAECAKAGNIHAIFICALSDYYYRKKISTGLAKISYAAEATHFSAMYVYGMILIGEGQFEEGSNYVTKLWKNQGMQVVRQCQQNCRHVILELSVRKYREYDLLLTKIEVGDTCVVGEFDDVCDDCFIYKEIYRFIDYMHYV